MICRVYGHFWTMDLLYSSLYFGRFDIKAQKIPSSPMSYCIKTDIHIITCTKTLQEKGRMLSCMSSWDTPPIFSCLPPALLMWISLAICLRETRLGSVDFLKHFSSVHKGRIKLYWAHTATSLHNTENPVQKLSPKVPVWDHRLSLERGNAVSKEFTRRE